MLRRNARERKEYLYRKQLQASERETFQKKKKIREALSAGKPVPTELRELEANVRREMSLEDDRTAVAPDERDIDDEYRRAGEEDPKIFLTTCRDPSSRLVQFAKELKLVFPNCQRMNRGAYVIKDLVAGCRASGVTDLIVLHETRGRPDGMVISHLPYGPTAFFGISNCVMRHDLGDVPTMSLAFPHLVFTNFSTKIGERIGARTMVIGKS